MIRRYGLTFVALFLAFAMTALPVIGAPSPVAKTLVQGGQAAGATNAQYPVLTAGTTSAGAIKIIRTDDDGAITTAPGATPLEVEGDVADGIALTGVNPVLMGGQDGTNVQSLLTDTSGRSVIVGGAASGAAIAGNPVPIAGDSGGGLAVIPFVLTPGDGSSATQALRTVANGMVFNGTFWDRAKSANAAAATTGTGLAGAGILSKIGSNWEADVAAIGAEANAWSAAATGAGGSSTAVDCQQQAFVSAFGSVSGATTITLEVSQDNTTYYDTIITQVLGGAGEFCLNGTIGARYARLKSSANVTATATIAAKGG